MIIALDWDGTITQDIMAWTEFVINMTKRSHEVIIVTMRYPSEQENIKETTIGILCKVYYTSRRAKAEFLSTLDIFPDVWIDDNPNAVYQNAKAVFGTEKLEGQK